NIIERVGVQLVPTGPTSYSRDSSHQVAHREGAEKNEVDLWKLLAQFLLLYDTRNDGKQSLINALAAVIGGQSVTFGVRDVLDFIHDDPQILDLEILENLQTTTDGGLGLSAGKRLLEPFLDRLPTPGGQRLPSQLQQTILVFR